MVPRPQVPAYARPRARHRRARVDRDAHLRPRRRRQPPRQRALGRRAQRPPSTAPSPRSSARRSRSAARSPASTASASPRPLPPLGAARTTHRPPAPRQVGLRPPQRPQPRQDLRARRGLAPRVLSASAAGNLRVDSAPLTLPYAIARWSQSIPMTDRDFRHQSSLRRGAFSATARTAPPSATTGRASTSTAPRAPTATAPTATAPTATPRRPRVRRGLVAPARGRRPRRPRPARPRRAHQRLPPPRPPLGRPRPPSASRPSPPPSSRRGLRHRARELRPRRPHRRPRGPPEDTVRNVIRAPRGDVLPLHRRRVHARRRPRDAPLAPGAHGARRQPRPLSVDEQVSILKHLIDAEIFNSFSTPTSSGRSASRWRAASR